MPPENDGGSVCAMSKRLITKLEVQPSQSTNPASAVASKRRFEPNLQIVRAIIDGGVRRIRVCTRCLRSNKVTKAA